MLNTKHESLDDNKTYIFEGTEVSPTGRVATKTIGPVATSATGAAGRKFFLFEVAPVDKSFDWKKWVRREDLFEVQNH